LFQEKILLIKTLLM